jgi:RHS repeat-associated protein
VIFNPGQILDNNGNTLTKTDSTGTTNYTWDFENRLTSVTLPGTGGTVSFRYDPFGRRIYKSSSSGTSVFAYDADNPIEETNASGSAVTRYIQTDDLDEPLAMLRTSTTSYYEADGLGSITSMSSGAGSLAQTYTYDSFGHQTSSSGSLTNPFQYTAREWDSEINLYFYRARFYDPQTGRFLSEDPLAGGEDAKPNFYAYASNDPVDRFDPTGLSDLIYVRRANLILLRDGNGNIIAFYPAANNVSSDAKNDDGVTPTSPYAPGTYEPGPYHPHPETSNPNGPFGSNGIFLFPRPGCPGCGVHSGRANRKDLRGRKGPQHATNGCIRSTDDLTRKILELKNAGDPLKHLYVM